MAATLTQLNLRVLTVTVLAFFYSEFIIKTLDSV